MNNDINNSCISNVFEITLGYLKQRDIFFNRLHHILVKFNNRYKVGDYLIVFGPDKSLNSHNSYCIQKITTEDEGLLPNYEILDFIKEDPIE